MAETQTDSQNTPGGENRVAGAVEAASRRAGRFLATVAARTREEAEDIWAEAQSIRKGKNE